MKFGRAKVVSFLVFFCGWTYFRHYLNLWILWSVWTEFGLIPYVPLSRLPEPISPEYRAASMQWLPESGAWLAPWMKYQVFVPILLLQFLNLFWYFLILRILWRYVLHKNAAPLPVNVPNSAVTGSEVDDDRSDDEGDDHEKNE